MSFGDNRSIENDDGDGYGEGLSPKAEEALRELASRPLGERPLMLEWDVESELQQRWLYRRVGELWLVDL